MTLAVIALGSNIGDPAARLTEAFGALQELDVLSRFRTSHVYSSPPLGPQDQPPFLNAAIAAQFDGDSFALLRSLQAIERRMGRVKTQHWGERCIDLDIIQLGDCVISSPTLSVPHPEAINRLFVIQPMIDLFGCEHQIPGFGSLGVLREKLINDTLSLCTEIRL